MQVSINREYVSKTHGNIGKVDLVADVTKVTLDGKELSESSVEYLLRFSLQCLQDTYGKADMTAEDAIAAFETKRKNILDGTIGSRSGGAGVPEEVRVARVVMREWYIAGIKSDDAKRKAWKEMDEEAKVKQLDALIAIEANAKKLAPVVAERIKRMAAERAAIAEMSKGLVLSI